MAAEGDSSAGAGADAGADVKRTDQRSDYVHFGDVAEIQHVVDKMQRGEGGEEGGGEGGGVLISPRRQERKKPDAAPPAAAVSAARAHCEGGKQKDGADVICVQRSDEGFDVLAGAPAAAGASRGAVTASVHAAKKEQQRKQRQEMRQRKPSSSSSSSSVGRSSSSCSGGGSGGGGGGDGRGSDGRRSANEASSERSCSELAGPPREDVAWEELGSLEMISEGEFCAAYRAHFEGHTVLVKRMKPGCASKEEAQQGLERELAILTQIHHPNIVRLHGSGKAPDRFLILELLQHGTLATALAVRRQPQSVRFVKALLSASTKPDTGDGGGERGGGGGFVPVEEMSAPSFLDSVRQIRDLARALRYLHWDALYDHRILHRDLKSNNIGFAANGTLKLFDFGSATLIEKDRLSQTGAANEHAYFKLTGEMGSYRYMAPEVALHKAYNESCDVYSFAILAWEIACGRLPYAGLTRDEFYTQVIIKGERPPLLGRWPDSFRTLLRTCWRPNPANRPDFQHIASSMESLVAQVERVGSQGMWNDVISRLFVAPLWQWGSAHSSHDDDHAAAVAAARTAIATDASRADSKHHNEDREHHHHGNVHRPHPHPSFQNPDFVLPSDITVETPSPPSEKEQDAQRSEPEHKNAEAAPPPPPQQQQLQEERPPVSESAAGTSRGRKLPVAHLQPVAPDPAEDAAERTVTPPPAKPADMQTRGRAASSDLANAQHTRGALPPPRDRATGHSAVSLASTPSRNHPHPHAYDTSSLRYSFTTDMMVPKYKREMRRDFAVVLPDDEQTPYGEELGGEFLGTSAGASADADGVGMGAIPEAPNAAARAVSAAAPGAASETEQPNLIHRVASVKLMGSVRDQRRLAFRKRSRSL